MNAAKPLGHKSYGSIPHLPGSRLGPGDHHCHDGQRAICWEKARDRHDRIIVTEKLDGSNCAVAKLDGKIIALGRAGYLASTSRFEQHQMFAAWVRDNEERFLASLVEGERLVGEWMAQAHGTIYELPSHPFVPFDLMRGQARFPFDAMRRAARVAELPDAYVLHDGAPCTLEKALAILGDKGFHGSTEPPEGAVWRVERRGEFDFLAKWVRADKQDGKYLPEVSGKPPVWHIEWRIPAAR